MRTFRQQDPIILPSIPSGGLEAAQVHARVRGQAEFVLSSVGNSWVVALERWSGNHPKTPWRAHLFDARTGRWRGTTQQGRQTPEQSHKDALAAISQKQTSNKQQ